MSAAFPHASVPTYRPSQPSPLVLTKQELIGEGHELMKRIAHSNLPARDAMLVAELVVRYARMPL